jgi:hypothetical protein
MNVFRLTLDILSYCPAELSLEMEERRSLDRALWSRESLADCWKPLAMKQVDPSLPVADFFNFYTSGVLCLRERVLDLDAARVELSRIGELLPAFFGDEPVVVLHLLNEKREIDIEKSTTRRLMNGNMVVYKPVFLSRDKCSDWIFAIDGDVSLYAGDPFKRFYERFQLSGLKFEEQEVAG